MREGRCVRPRQRDAVMSPLRRFRSNRDNIEPMNSGDPRTVHGLRRSRRYVRVAGLTRLGFVTQPDFRGRASTSIKRASTPETCALARPSATSLQVVEHN